MARRPLVGITCYVEQARWGVWDFRASLLPQVYVDSVTAAGGRALVLPPDSTDDAVLDALDALVVAGGVDVDPARYGAVPHPSTDAPQPERDAGELLLISGAFARDLPLLGVCRGAQLMAVARGGTLIQDLPSVVGHHDHREVLGVFSWHTVRAIPGSRVADALGDTDLKVNAHHHQAVDDPGELVVTARADDGTIEAVEDPALRFAVGVQWHPEMLDDRRLFTALIDAARLPRVL
ncbi:gamma-glutamyl-gamma-aminobutyrate hydrolase family protein [Cryptosporangium aurantiacum]|uniref:Putative glutamine amidotransferase n=1 Tax=Cryptosporangium aurantiacum TaxID=134849 RepID=A0A1M7HNB5_9ACTN|nr:gamma-glutamyl-gamma-aminobutyrate hydrolase family protein [Cryptosporangium aurantiacum]SHM29929.1 putative glutamine amidotransferase [Cryptosporangium aurantiacum]